jgi:hypothetical protein
LLRIDRVSPSSFARAAESDPAVTDTLTRIGQTDPAPALRAAE